MQFESENMFDSDEYSFQSSSSDTENDENSYLNNEKTQNEYTIALHRLRSLIPNIDKNEVRMK